MLVDRPFSDVGQSPADPIFYAPPGGLAALIMLIEPSERREPLLTTLEIAKLLKVSPRCLSNWRHRGGGPKFLRLSNSAVRYRFRDIEDWLEARLVSQKAR